MAKETKFILLWWGMGRVSLLEAGVDWEPPEMRPYSLLI